MDSYFVVNTESRKVMFGPYRTREEADAKHYEICSKGIPTGDGEVKRPRCAVVIEHALTSNDQGNHFVHDKPTFNEAASGTVRGEFDTPRVLPPGGDMARPGNTNPEIPSPEPPAVNLENPLLRK